MGVAPFITLFILPHYLEVFDSKRCRSSFLHRFSPSLFSFRTCNDVPSFFPTKKKSLLPFASPSLLSSFSSSSASGKWGSVAAVASLRGGGGGGGERPRVVRYAHNTHTPTTREGEGAEARRHNQRYGIRQFQTLENLRLRKARQLL